MAAFVNELSLLYRKNWKSTPPIRVPEFRLFLSEDQTIRCKGRISNAPLPTSCKSPILLPAKHTFVKLVIKQTQDRVRHSEINATLTALRERYWVLRGREEVKTVVRHCVVCRRNAASSCKPTQFLDLPCNRVSDAPPLTHIRSDFAGPLYVKEARRSSQESDSDSNKVYVSLSTCASTRAVLPELTKVLNIRDFLLAFPTFASRRGLPATIQSDNAKTFQSSSKEIRKLSRSPEVWRSLHKNRITWIFIVEKSPWWASYCETLVRSTNSPIKKVIGRCTVSYDEMHTLLTEVETVNNADLIYYRRITVKPGSQHYETISTYNSLTKRFKHYQQWLSQFTRRWRNKYLTSLREQFAKGSSGRVVNAKFKVGDVVILKKESVARAFWKLTKVEELLPGRDGNVRAAIVTVPRDVEQAPIPINLWDNRSTILFRQN